MPSFISLSTINFSTEPVFNKLRSEVMGDIGIGYTMSQRFLTQELSSGWSFKQADDTSDDAWLPVKKVPSTVQQDLLDHKK